MRRIEVVSNGRQPGRFTGEIIASYTLNKKGIELAHVTAERWTVPALIHMPDGRFLNLKETT